MRTVRLVKLLTAITVIAVSGYFLFALPLKGSAQDTSSAPQPPNPILKRPVFVFSYLPGISDPNYIDPKTLRSVTVFVADPGKDLEYWVKRGVMTASGAKENPWPATDIDEDGADFGGPIDNSQAIQLRKLKKDRPDRSILVFQTPRPIKGMLPRAYKKYADLIMLEAYAHSYKDYPIWFDSAVDNMRRLGLLEKSVLILGPGPTGAETKEEILQQVRYIRWIAPEIAGIGTFGGTRELLPYLDELCLQWDKIPTDGRDLPDDVRAIHESYIQPHKEPTLLASGEWATPVGPWPNITKWIVCIRNLGDKDAFNVRVRLYNQRRGGPQVSVEGFIRRIPAHGEAVKSLRATAPAWPPFVEIEAPGATVLSFPLYWE